MRGLAHHRADAVISNEHQLQQHGDDYRERIGQQLHQLQRGAGAEPQRRYVHHQLGNAGILVEPIAGCTTIGINPALQIGASNTLSVGSTWYADAALTTAVGAYSPNSLTLNGGNAGLNTVYFAVTDAANSCTTIASVDVSLSLAVGITAQPVAGSAVCVGGAVTASVSATGTAATSGRSLTGGTTRWGP